MKVKIILVKAYGKKDIAKLLPKYTLITGNKRRPFYMKTYIRPDDYEERYKLIEEDKVKEYIKNQTKRLHTGVRVENLKIVKDAIEHGADVNGKDSEYRTPLMRSAANNYWKEPEISRYLLEHGADPNIVDYDGRTALIHATMSNQFCDKEVKNLLEHGADPNIQDDQGKTALMYLAEEYDVTANKEQLNALDYLLRYGAKDNIEDRKGHTVWDYIEKHDFWHDPQKKEFVKILLKYNPYHTPSFY